MCINKSLQTQTVHARRPVRMPLDPIHLFLALQQNTSCSLASPLFMLPVALTDSLSLASSSPSLPPIPQLKQKFHAQSQATPMTCPWTFLTLSLSLCPILRIILSAILGHLLNGLLFPQSLITASILLEHTS